MNNETVTNSHIVFRKVLLISCCIILPLAPFIIAYIVITKPDKIEGSITNKRTKHTSSDSLLYSVLFMPHVTYYVTIGSKELMVSSKIWEMLKLGDYISAAYRNDMLHYYTKP